MPNDEMSLEALQKKMAELQSDLGDLQQLYDNTLEHATSLEEDLVNQNKRMQVLQNKMRKYLSPQLYAALLGGTADASTKVHARKKLAIYFSDLVGFSDLTDSIEPELLSDVLNAYLTRMSEIALKYGGTVYKFIGDAILVFFGDPEAIDDVTHVRQCTAMALEMREELFRLRELWKIKGINRTLQARAGINIGYCTAGNFGSENRMDYTIIGGQVNIASRLQAAAQPDSILMSSAAYSLVEDFVEARPLGLMSLKGIHTGVEVYEVLGLRSGTLGQNTAQYLQVKNSRIEIQAMNIDLDSASDGDLEIMRKALSQALVALSVGKSK